MIKLSDNALLRLRELRTKNNHKFVRLDIKGGGCAGFEYQWTFEDEAEVEDVIVDDIVDSGNTMKAVMKFLSVKDPKSMTPVAAIYKENGDFEKVLHILHQDVDTIFDPWYIGYGMDDDKGHNRNLSTIYTI